MPMERVLVHFRIFKFLELVVNVIDILTKVLLILLQVSGCKNNYYNYNDNCGAT
jgi:hypothetical protein